MAGSRSRDPRRSAGGSAAWSLNHEDDRDHGDGGGDRERVRPQEPGLEPREDPAQVAGVLPDLAGPGGDLAGYPNGRRPSDDVVDISLVAMMGGLCVANGNNDTYKLGAACKPSAAPLGSAAFGLHDGVDQAGPKVKANGPLLPAFPYLGTPLPGAQ